MKSSLPISNLHRLTLLMDIWINLFVLVLMFTSKDVALDSIVPSILKSFVLIYLLGLTNIFAMHLVSRHYADTTKKTEWIRYGLSAMLSLGVVVGLSILFEYLSPADDANDENKFAIRLVVFVIFHILTVVLQDQVILQDSKAQAELENVRLKATIIEASNLLLRQQIHPHFLFNSLTILKSLYKKDAGKGEFYLTRLANFLRASISDNASKVTALQTELMMCMDYMEMQKIRFGSAIEYNVDVSEQSKSKFVPFFSIQVLLENAIKHNALTEENPLMINVSDTYGFISVKNNLQTKSNKEVSTGQGLANLAERYRLLSGDQISIKQDQDSFSVTVKMYENENCDH